MTKSSRTSSALTLSSLPGPIPKVLALTPLQEVLVRQLGGAIVLHWDALPDALQDLLIDQAAIGPYGDDERFAPALIENFIRKAKTTAVRPLQHAEPSQHGPPLHTI